MDAPVSRKLHSSGNLSQFVQKRRKKDYVIGSNYLFLTGKGEQGALRLRYLNYTCLGAIYSGLSLHLHAGQHSDFFSTTEGNNGDV